MDYKNQGDATIRISYISGVSGVIYIDNVAIKSGKPVGLAEKQQNSNFSVFPNPAEKMLNVQWSNLPVQYLTLYHTSGKQVMNKRVDKENVSQESFHVGHLKSGIYFLRLQTEHGSRYRKVVVK